MRWTTCAAAACWSHMKLLLPLQESTPIENKVFDFQIEQQLPNCGRREQKNTGYYQRTLGLAATLRFFGCTAPLEQWHLQIDQRERVRMGSPFLLPCIISRLDVSYSDTRVFHSFRCECMETHRQTRLGMWKKQRSPCIRVILQIAQKKSTIFPMHVLC
jgi:hypothetical protein